MPHIQNGLFEQASGDAVQAAALLGPRSAKYDMVSMFSGCGGMDLGFRGAFTVFGRSYCERPFRVVWANDINSAACRTYRHNLGAEIREGDAWALMDTLPAACDVVIGGFPCQDISVNGKGAGVDGRRSGLYRAMVAAVSRLRPRVFVAENVKGLLMRHNASSLRKVLRDFSELGYRVSFDLYQAADYGVPQTRERVFIVGTRPDLPPFKAPPRTRFCQRPMTAGEALDDLKLVAEDPAINHIWSRAERSPDQGSRRLKRDRPAYTIRAECHGNIQFHYEEGRRISMREAARIQSFPDEFTFQSGLRETERQVGNAVPPVLAWHMATAVAACLAEGTGGQWPSTQGGAESPTPPMSGGRASKEHA